MRVGAAYILLCSLLGAGLAGCGAVRVSDTADNQHVLTYELDAVDSLYKAESILTDKAWKVCPEGWTEVIEPGRDYANGAGTALRMYHTDAGPFGAYQATVRCVAN